MVPDKDGASGWADFEVPGQMTALIVLLPRSISKEGTGLVQRQGLLSFGHTDPGWNCSFGSWRHLQIMRFVASPAFLNKPHGHTSGERTPLHAPGDREEWREESWASAGKMRNGFGRETLC